MIRTLYINDLEKYADNIYEATIILAKRARQINAEQKQMLMRDREYDDDYEGFDDEEVEIQKERYVRLPKPTNQALEEFLNGKVRYVYRDSSEDAPSVEK